MAVVAVAPAALGRHAGALDDELTFEIGDLGTILETKERYRAKIRVLGHPPDGGPVTAPGWHDSAMALPDFSATSASVGNDSPRQAAATPRDGVGVS